MREGEKMEKNTKKTGLAVAALALLMLTRWIFIRLEIDSSINTPLFAAEAAYIVVAYALYLFGAPKAVSYICIFAGCAGLCALDGVFNGFGDAGFLRPLVYLPVFAFLISQTPGKSNSPIPFFATILAPAVLTVVFLTERRSFPGAHGAYLILVSLLTAAVFALIAAVKKQQIKRKKNELLSPDPKPVFAAATAAIALTGLCLTIRSFFVTAHTLPVLWIVDLMILREEEHAAVTAFADSLKKKVNAFLGAPDGDAS